MSPTWYYNLLPSNLGDRLFIAVLIAAQICSDIYSFGNKEYFLLARRYVKSESVVCVCGEFLCLHGATFRAAGTRLLPLAAVIVMLPVSCSPMRCRGWLTASECPGTFPSPDHTLAKPSIHPFSGSPPLFGSWSQNNCDCTANLSNFFQHYSCISLENFVSNFDHELGNWR